MTLIKKSRLLELIAEPNAADNGLDEVTGLALDLRGASFHADDVSRIVSWLIRQPIPSVGLVEKGGVSSLAEGLDLMLDSEASCEQVLANISERPKASAVLVQVLRTTGSLPISAALAVESLGYATLQGGVEFARWLETRQASGDVNNSAANPVKLERDASTLHVLLNSPANRNALSVAMRDALADTFKMVVMDDSIKRVEVSGNGPCFSAGGDLTEFGQMRDVAEAHHIRQVRMPAQYLALCAERCSFNLHGACIGAGIELPAFAAHITAKQGTYFRLPEVQMGLIPGAGGCVSIPRRIGRHRANYLAITGEKLFADEALAWGLIDEIVA